MEKLQHEIDESVVFCAYEEIGALVGVWAFRASAFLTEPDPNREYVSYGLKSE